MSRSSDQNEESPGEPEVFFVGGRLQRDTVSAGGFEAFIITTLGLWITALFIVFRAVYEIRLEDPDLSIIASVSATLAGLALAFLTLIYQLNPKDRFLKLGFSFLTFVLLISTILVVAALMVYDRSFDAKPRVEVWFLCSAVLAAPLLGRRYAKKQWSKFESVAYLLPFIIPLPLVFAISDKKLLTASVLLLLLGVIGLPVLMTVFVYGTFRRPQKETTEERFFNASVERWHRRLEEESHFANLKDKLLNILKRKKETQLVRFNEKDLDTDELLVPVEELNGHPELPNESQSLISRALTELADRNKIYSGYRTRGYYIAPTPDEINEALSYFRERAIIVWLEDEKPSTELQDRRLAKELAKKFLYPRSVVAKYLLQPLTIMLKEEYLRSSDWGIDLSKWELYARRDVLGLQNALSIWEARESRGSFRWAKMSHRLRKSVSQEVLPEGVDERLGDDKNLSGFLDEFKHLEPKLREEIASTEAEG